MATFGYCQGADFCAEIGGETDLSFTRTYQGDPPSRRVATTEHFVVVIDISPLAVGHLLLLPKQHYFSFAQILAYDPYELYSLLEWLVPVYEATFGSPVILEHGSSEDDDHSACITHAHWHLVPTDVEAVDKIMVADELTPYDLGSLVDLGKSPWTDTPYFFRTHPTGHRVYKPTAITRRQYLRSVVGRTLSIDDPEWDYAVVVRKEYLRTTITMVQQWNIPDQYVQGP